MDIKHLTRRDWLLILATIGVTVAAVALVVAGLSLIDPAPPKQIVISTGPEGGAAHRAAERYRAILARDGVKVVLKNSTGAVENLARLRSAASGVTAAFLQTGTADESDSEIISAIAGLYVEPVWVFVRAGRGATEIRDLKGLRIAVGGLGSGSRRVAMALLPRFGINADNTRFVDVSGLTAASAIRRPSTDEGAVDAMLVVTGEESPVVQSLLKDKTLSLMSVAQAHAVSRQFTWLNTTTLVRGIVDLERNVPATDVELVAAISQLMVRSDTHPAIATLLAQAAGEVHRNAGWFSRAGDFPNTKGLDVPVSEDAARYFRSGKPLLQRYLPFWLVVWVERALVILVPLLALLLPASQVLPPLYRWRMRSRIYRWYRELRAIEREFKTRGDMAHAEARIAALYSRVAEVEVPPPFQRELFDLREHIDEVRVRVART